MRIKSRGATGPVFPVIPVHRKKSCIFLYFWNFPVNPVFFHFFLYFVYVWYFVQDLLFKFFCRNLCGVLVFHSRGCVIVDWNLLWLCANILDWVEVALTIQVKSIDMIACLLLHLALWLGTSCISVWHDDDIAASPGCLKSLCNLILRRDLDLIVLYELC